MKLRNLKNKNRRCKFHNVKLRNGWQNIRSRNREEETALAFSFRLLLRKIHLPPGGRQGYGEAFSFMIPIAFAERKLHGPSTPVPTRRICTKIKWGKKLILPLYYFVFGYALILVSRASGDGILRGNLRLTSDGVQAYDE